MTVPEYDPDCPGYCFGCDVQCAVKIAISNQTKETSNKEEKPAPQTS